MTTLQSHERSRPATVSTPHEHGWVVESSHATSAGRILYVRCAACGVRRVDLHRHGQPTPAALSREIADGR